MSKNTDAILELIRHNSGRISAKEITANGFRRECLSQMVEEGQLLRESRGIYVLPDTPPDPYYPIRHSCPKAIFSYETALKLQNFLITGSNCTTMCAEEVPIHITVQQGFHMTNLKHICSNIEIHYVQPKRLKLGLIEQPISEGSVLRYYDMERCICDIVYRHQLYVKSRKLSDDTKVGYETMFPSIIREYFNNDNKNLLRLQTYAHEFGLEDTFYQYMELFM